MNHYNNTLIDLHTHSNFSDGSDSPEDLIKAAKIAGVNTLALTDHDTVAGAEVASNVAASCGVRFIPGVELALQHGEHEVHILGLGLNIETGSGIEDLLRRVLKSRLERNLAIVERMRQYGIAIDYPEIEAEADGDSVGRPHMARVLIRRGIANDTTDAFRRFLGTGCLFHVPRRAVQLYDAVETLKDSGGHAVLAHPAASSLTNLKNLIETVHEVGVDGVEAYHPALSSKQSAAIKTFADMFNMFVTGGSDYHGSYSPNRSLGYWQTGVKIPELTGSIFSSTES